MIQDPLAMQILEGKVLPGDQVRVDRDGQKDAMRFERVRQGKASCGGGDAVTAEGMIRRPFVVGGDRLSTC